LSEFPIAPSKSDGYVETLTISGLSLGVLVVEAARQSGSQPAHDAMNQNREVFAIPGSFYSRWRAAAALIRSGARSW
jgi:DNA processing protein